MSFLLPALLWLLPLAAIPVVLHLLTLHRLKTVELSTYRFLFDSYIQQRRRMQFLEALLAALRTLFLVLVVLMIAGPTFSVVGGLFSLGQGPVHVVLLVDCSPSMNAGAEGQTSFTAAQDAALRVVKSLREQDTLTLIQVAGPEPKVLYSGQIHEKSPNETASDNRLSPAEAVHLLRLTASDGDVFAALMKVFGPEAHPQPNSHYFLITDCQASGWRKVPDQGLKGLIPEHTPFAVVNVGAGETPNQAVIGDAPSGAGAVVGRPCFLQARVLNASKKEAANLTLSLVLKEKQVERVPLKLEPGETVVHRFTFVPREAGDLRGSFEISSVPPDHFPDDDRYLFALNVAPSIRVVIVDGQQPGPPLKDQDNVDEAHYLKFALTSADRGGAAQEKPSGGAADGAAPPFDVRVVPETALTPAAPGQPPEALKDADVVVLANCGGLQGPQFDELRTFAADGGGLLIFPGDRVNQDTCNTQFFPVPGPQGDSLTDARLEAPRGDPNDFTTFEQLAKIDFGRPALAALDDADAKTRFLSTARIYRRFKVTLPDKKGNASPLAWFSDGSAALVESRLGEGDVILSAFPAHMRWTNLPAKPDFTALLLELVHHAARRQAVTAPTVVLADGQANFTVDSKWGDVHAEMTKQVTRTGVDPKTATAESAGDVRFQRTGPRLDGRFSQTSEPGYYTLTVTSPDPRPGAPAQRTFAVNISKEESDFETLGAEQVGKLLPSVHLDWFDYAKDHEKLDKYLHGDGGPLSDIWWVLVLLVIFVNELFLAMRGGRRGQAGDDGAAAERVRQMRAGSWVGGMAARAR